MYRAHFDPLWSLDAWRIQARAAWRAQVNPDAIHWSDSGQEGLFARTAVTQLPPVTAAPRVPSDFLSLAATVLCNRSVQVPAVLYRMLWRIAQGERTLLMHLTDPDVHRVREWRQAVRRDSHKMKAFVRFRVLSKEKEAYVAWFEPEHYILERVAPFFVRRFSSMQWAILTPYRSVHWDGQTLCFGAGADPTVLPPDNAQQDLWLTYYAHIFNPARLNSRVMCQQIPKKYWKNLPEAELLPQLIRDAGPRVHRMLDRQEVNTLKKIK